MSPIPADQMGALVADWNADCINAVAELLHRYRARDLSPQRSRRLLEVTVAEIQRHGGNPLPADLPMIVGYLDDLSDMAGAAEWGCRPSLQGFIGSYRMPAQGKEDGDE